MLILGPLPFLSLLPTPPATPRLMLTAAALRDLRIPERTGNRALWSEGVSSERVARVPRAGGEHRRPEGAGPGGETEGASPPQ